MTESRESLTDQAHPPAMTPVLMPNKGRYAGEPADASSRRSIELVSSLDEDPVVFDYFFHVGRYWRATISLASVETIFGQCMNFSEKKTQQGASGKELVLDKSGVPKGKLPILNHVQTRFVLKAGETVDLFPLGRFDTPHYNDT